MQQEDAIRKLEQLTIKKWRYIKAFEQDLYYYTTLVGCFYEELILEKLFLKLPGEL